LAASLNINCKFYNKENINDNKIILYNETSFGMVLGWVSISLLPVSYPCFEIKKTQTHTQSKRRKPVKSELVKVDDHIYEFCYHVYSPPLQTLKENQIIYLSCPFKHNQSLLFHNIFFNILISSNLSFCGVFIILKLKQKLQFSNLDIQRPIQIKVRIF